MTNTEPETPMERTAPIYTIGDLLDRLEAYREMHEAAGFEPESFRSKDHAQYFTPYDVSRFMATLTLDNDQTREHIERHGFVTINEPAAGAGGMVIAAAQTLRDMGFNPQRQLHATCWDIESTAAHMCFVQLSLLGIPAVVVLGDTLTLEARQVLETPAHIWGLWRYRLAKHRDEADAPEPNHLGPLSEQGPLFTTPEVTP